jgi:hypothetical protein
MLRLGGVLVQRPMPSTNTKVKRDFARTGGSESVSTAVATQQPDSSGQADGGVPYSGTDAVHRAVRALRGIATQGVRPWPVLPPNLSSELCTVLCGVLCWSARLDGIYTVLMRGHQSHQCFDGARVLCIPLQQIVDIQRVAPTPSSTASLNQLHPALVTALKALGVRSLYTHQSQGGAHPQPRKHTCSTPVPSMGC